MIKGFADCKVAVIWMAPKEKNLLILPQVKIHREMYYCTEKLGDPKTQSHNSETEWIFFSKDKQKQWL